MTCTQAELYRLLNLIDKEVFQRAGSLREARKKWKAIKEHIEDLTLEELRSELGL